jgi:hypothetical protein
MPYVQRQDDAIENASALPTTECTEFIEYDDPEYLAWFKPHLESAYDLSDYRSQRHINYPDMGDQLDMIIKALKHLKDTIGIDIGSDGDALVAKVDAVKAAYPKS